MTRSIAPSSTLDPRRTDPLSVGLVCPYSLSHPGGVQNHVFGLAEELTSHGHRVSILAPGELSSATSSTPPAFEVVSAGAGMPVHYNGSVARVSFGPRSAARVRTWLEGHQFDVLHLHEPVTPSVALMALTAADVPIVSTFHTATPRSMAMRIAGRVLDPWVKRIDAAIAVSASAQQVVRSHLGLEPRIIPNGIRGREFLGPRLTGGIPRLTLLGRMDESRKGLDVMLQALPQIRRQVGEVDVVVAGPGRRPLPLGVRRAGLLTASERSTLLRSTDVFVAPHTGRESFGLVLLEAMASGAKVVASDLPAFTDVLQSPTGESMGDTFVTGDAGELARIVCHALTGPAKPGAVAHALGYDWSSIGAEVIKVYRQAMRDRPFAAKVA